MAGPDLIVTATAYDPPTQKFSATLKNVGSTAITPSQKISVRYYVDGVERSYGSVTQVLAAGASVNIGSVPLYTIPAGTYTLDAWADPTLLIAEDDETNNHLVVVVDRTPPTSVITAPTTGATLSGSTVNLAVTSTDDIGVVGVQFKLDGVNIGAEEHQLPYAIVWDSTTVSDGAHVLTALARDAAGNTTTSASVNVTVDNTAAVDDYAIQGFAKVANVTGGAGGAVYTVTSGANSGTNSLYDYINRAGARTIKFTPGLTATISMPPASGTSPYMYLQNGNVTLDGKDANITITGASINTNGKSNIIIKNMTFKDNIADGSAVQIDWGSYNVWVDHNTFSGQTSGSTSGQPIAVWNHSTTGLDGSASELTGVTLSWNHYKAVNSRAVLTGSESHNTGNTVVLPTRISSHHNWYDNCTTRNPRAHSKGATIHEWNSYATANWSEAPVTINQGAAYYGQNNIYEPLGSQKQITNNADFYFPTDGPVGIRSDGEYLLNGATITDYGSFPMDRITYTAPIETADATLKARIIAGAGANN